METLKEIINIITRDRIKNIEIVGSKSGSSSKLDELYNGIQNGKFKTDEEAAAYFYGTNAANNENYKKLKKRLQKRLVNTIFFIDTNQPAYDEIQKAYYNCYKDWAAVKIMLGKGGRRAAIPIALGVVKKAVKFEFSDLALDISRILRNHYAAIDGDRSKYELYNSYVKKYCELLNAELMAEEYYQSLVGNYSLSKTTSRETETVAVEYTKELKQITKKLSSYRLNLYSYLTFVLRYQMVNDYKNMIRECEKALQNFESNKAQASKSAIYNFLYKMLACYIQLKEFEQGEKVANRCLGLLREGEANWFNTLEQYLLLSFHTDNLHRAFNIYCRAKENKGFKNLYSSATENWRVFEAYIQYFILIGAIRLSPSEEQMMKKFGLKKFLNDVPVHSKDKKRRNIPILIIHVLFLLQNKSYDLVMSRLESLNLYSHRYLLKDDTFRSNCFIKMLMQLPKANFNRIALKRKAEKYYIKLKQNPSNLSMQASEIEIMPYEILWDYVLNSLDSKGFYK